MDLEKTENQYSPLSNDQILYLMSMRQTAWDMFASAALTMARHPGTTKHGPMPLSYSEIADIADKMLEERDRRFGGT